ncbi:7tm 6 domain containing protein, partial [Asbolus verrucosus]
KWVKDSRLPFLAWYPYNSKVSPFYEITYVYQIVSISFIAIANSNIDTLIAALNMYIGAQFDILCDDLRNLQDLTQSASLSFNEKLTDCIQHHKKILSFAEDSNNCFNWIIFLQFFASSLSISLTLFQMTVVIPLTNEFNSLFSFVSAMLVEIFIYCWFGNEVEIKSSNVPYALFESDWINVDKETKRNMIIFMLRCQKPLKISALNLFYLSLETFMRILRTAWSYFALLHQLNSRN